MTSYLDRQRQLAGIVESRPGYKVELNESAPVTPEAPQATVQEDQGLDPDLVEFVESIQEDLSEEEATYAEFILCMSENVLAMEVERLEEEYKAITDALNEGANTSKYKKPLYPQDKPWKSHRSLALKHSGMARKIRDPHHTGDSPESKGSPEAVVIRAMRNHAIAAHQHFHAAKDAKAELDNALLANPSLPKHYREAFSKKAPLIGPFARELETMHPDIAKQHRAWVRHSQASDLHQKIAGVTQIHRKGGYWIKADQNPDEHYKKAIEYMHNRRAWALAKKAKNELAK